MRYDYGIPNNPIITIYPIPVWRRGRYLFIPGSSLKGFEPISFPSENGWFWGSWSTPVPMNPLNWLFNDLMCVFHDCKAPLFWINSFMDSFGACFFVEFCQFEPRQFFGGIQSVEVPNWCAVFWVIRWGSALWPPPSPTVVKALQDVRISSWTWSFLMLDVSWLSTSKSNKHSIPNSCTFDFDRFLSESWTFPFDQIVIGCHWCHQQTAVAICLKCHWPQRRPLRPGMHKTLARPARRPDNPEALAQEKAGGSAIGFASPIIGDDELSLQSYSCWWYIITILSTIISTLIIINHDYDDHY